MPSDPAPDLLLTRATVEVQTNRSQPTWIQRLRIHPPALLIGLTAGWFWSGMQQIVASIIDPISGATSTLLSIVFLAATIGPWLPERAIHLVTGFLKWRSRRCGETDWEDTGSFWMLRAVRERDEALLWLLVSFIAAAAGLASLVTLLLTSPYTQLYEWLLTRFFWTSLTLTALEWLLLSVWLAPAGVLHGLLLAVLAPLDHSHGDRRGQLSGVLSSLLVGLGIALLVHYHWGRFELSGDQVVLLGLLPAFILAGVAAYRSQSVSQKAVNAEPHEPPAPEYTAGKEGWVCLSFTTWGCGLAFAMIGSSTAAEYLPWPILPVRPDWIICMMAGGVVLAATLLPYVDRTVSSCGLALWFAGIAVGLAGTILSFHSPETPTLLHMPLVAIAFGVALHVMKRAWLLRVGSETLGFAQMVSAGLLGLAIGLMLAKWLVLPSLGSMGTIAAGALVLIGYGGLAQIYEEHRPPRSQHRRLAFVFASLALAMLILPGNARRWAHALTRDVEHTSSLAWPVADVLNDNHRFSDVCLINVPPTRIPASLSDHVLRLDCIQTKGRLPPFRREEADRTEHGIALPAHRWLRLADRKYDLVYQYVDTTQSPNDTTARLYSVEWLHHLRQAVAPSGWIVLDVSLAGFDDTAIRYLTSTFAYVMGETSAYALVHASQPHEVPAICLAARPGSFFPDNVPSTGPDNHLAWQLLHPRLADSGHMVSPHSVRRNCLPISPTQDTTENSAGIPSWLTPDGAMAVPRSALLD